MTQLIVIFANNSKVKIENFLFFYTYNKKNKFNLILFYTDNNLVFIFLKTRFEFIDLAVGVALSLATKDINGDPPIAPIADILRVVVVKIDVARLRLDDPIALFHVVGGLGVFIYCPCAVNKRLLYSSGFREDVQSFVDLGYLGSSL